jgi:hypothetical protein
MHLGRIEFIIVLFTDWSFASGCSPPILSFTQLPSATDRPVLLSGRDFHPTVGAYFQAHSSSPFGAQTIQIIAYLRAIRVSRLFIYDKIAHKES